MKYIFRVKKKLNVSGASSNIGSFVPARHESRYFAFPSPMNLVLRKSIESPSRREMKRSGNESVRCRRAKHRGPAGNQGQPEGGVTGLTLYPPSLFSQFSTFSYQSDRARDHAKLRESDEEALGWSADFGE